MDRAATYMLIKQWIKIADRGLITEDEALTEIQAALAGNKD